jgi:hypothetical protein
MTRLRIEGPRADLNALAERFVEALESLSGGEPLGARERANLRKRVTFPLGMLIPLAQRDVRLDWLLTGEGEPLDSRRMAVLRERVQRLSAELGALSRTVAEAAEAARMTSEDLLRRKADSGAALEAANAVIRDLTGQLRDLEAQLCAENFRL